MQGVIYTVTSMTEEETTVQMRPEYRKAKKTEEDGEEDAPAETKVPTKEVTALFRLTHAMCYFTVQGRSFDLGRKTLLLDTDHKMFSRRHLIVGMSRVRRGNDLHIATPEYATNITGRTRKTICRA